MTTLKAALSRLYWNGPSTEWAHALRSFVDEGLAALCIRHWQRVPITVATPGINRSRHHDHREYESDRR